MAASEAPGTDAGTGGDTVMAAVDGGEYVIADTAADGAWLAAPTVEARDLDGWR
jgi:hypothetical protein